MTDSWQRHDRTYDRALYMQHLGAIDHGVKLGAEIYGTELGTELSANSSTCLCRAQGLSASNDGAEL